MTAWLIAVVLRRRPNTWGVPALAVGVTSVAVQLIQSLIFPSFSELDQFKLKTGTDTVVGALLEAPGLAADILEHDLVTIARTDYVLLVLITLSTLSMVIF